MKKYFLQKVRITNKGRGCEAFQLKCGKYVWSDQKLKAQYWKLHWKGIECLGANLYFMRTKHNEVFEENGYYHLYKLSVFEMGRYMPVYHTGTSFCSWISYRHLSMYTISIYLFPFFWRYILVSLLISVPALLNFHFQHCVILDLGIWK